MVNVVQRLFNVNRHPINYKSTFQSNTVTLNCVDRRFALIHVDLMFDVKSTQFGVKTTQIDVWARPASTGIDRDRPGVDLASIGVDRASIGVNQN